MPSMGRKAGNRHPGGAAAGAHRVAFSARPWKGDQALPIEHYDHMSVDEVVIELDHLRSAELREIRLYEARRRCRKTLLLQIDRRLQRQ